MIKDTFNHAVKQIKASVWVVSLVTIVGTAYYTYNKMQEIDSELTVLEREQKQLLRDIHGKDKQCQAMLHHVKIAQYEYKQMKACE